MLMLARNYHEQIVRRRHAVDFLGAALLTAGISTLLLALENSGGPALYLVAVGLLGGFIFVETRTPEPIVPLGLLSKPLIWVGYLVSTLSGAVQFGTTGFIPLFVQGAQGGSPLSVGAVLAPMSIGWPIGSVTSGRLILRLGYRPVLLAGLSATVLGTAALQLSQPATPVPLVMLNVALVGLGMGLTSTPVLISIQNAVGWQQRGVATALNQFSRTIGGSLGVALMGAALNLQAQTRLAGQASGPGNDPATVVRNLLDPAARVLYAGQLGVLQQALAEALRVVFILPLAFAGFALVLGVLAFPAGSVRDHMARRPAAGD
jgi:Na+/melibiose symporter-like transporter